MIKSAAVNRHSCVLMVVAFFGSAATANMCSKCYKATHAPASPPMTAASAPVTSVPAPALTPAAAPTPPQDRGATGASPAVAVATPGRGDGAGGSKLEEDVVMATPNSVVDTPMTKKNKKKKKKSSRKRCHHCKTRVGLTGFECRCSFVFCDKHRYADVHSCTYDYAADHRNLLQKANPKVVAAKLDRL